MEAAEDPFDFLSETEGDLVEEPLEVLEGLSALDGPKSVSSGWMDNIRSTMVKLDGIMKQLFFSNSFTVWNKKGRRADDNEEEFPPPF